MEQVRSHCREQLAAKPEGTSRRAEGTWELAFPRFVRKEGQRVFWASRFSINAKAYEQIPRQSSAYEAVSYPNLLTVPAFELAKSPALPDIPEATTTATGKWPSFYGGGQIQGELVSLSSLLGNERLAATGKTIVDVNWSVSVNIKGILSKPKIDSIQFIETTWERVA